VSGAVAADRPGPRSEPPGTAELLCALSYGSGLAAAERMEHGTNTAFVGVQLGRALGAGAGDLEAVFYGALVKDAGCGACGAVLARYFAEDEKVPRLDLNLVDLHSPRSMAAWTMSQLHLDPGLPARLARLAAFASRCGPIVHEATAVHCEVAADFAAGLGFGPHVQDAVHYQYERHDGRSPAFGRPAETIPRPAQILHLALAADLVRGLTGTEIRVIGSGRNTPERGRGLGMIIRVVVVLLGGVTWVDRTAYPRFAARQRRAAAAGAGQLAAGRRGRAGAHGRDHRGRRWRGPARITLTPDGYRRAPAATATTTPARSPVWRSARTGCSPPPATTRRRGSGTDLGT